MIASADDSAKDSANLGVDLLGPPELCPRARVGFGWAAVEVVPGLFAQQSEREGKLELLREDGLGAFRTGHVASFGWLLFFFSNRM